MLAINDCGKAADRIWFTLFHELGHVLHNHKRHLTISLKKNSLLDDEEKAANIFAEDSLIDRANYDKFVNDGDFSIDSIIEFSESEQIAPFVVIGRLQNDKYISPEMYHEYRISYHC